jgi:hypothetical protein
MHGRSHGVFINSGRNNNLNKQLVTFLARSLTIRIPKQARANKPKRKETKMKRRSRGKRRSEILLRAKELLARKCEDEDDSDEIEAAQDVATEKGNGSVGSKRGRGRAASTKPTSKTGQTATRGRGGQRKSKCDSADSAYDYIGIFLARCDKQSMQKALLGISNLFK